MARQPSGQAARAQLGLTLDRIDMDVVAAPAA
jgi:hypothetical protein